MHPRRDAHEVPDSVTIGFPVTCHYRGGNTALGRHGRHLRIEKGTIGHGELRLTHGIPLNSVTSCEVTERRSGGTEAQTIMAFGVPPQLGRHASKPLQVTDITVRTKDGQQALWTVDERSAAWVRAKLAATLAGYGIPFYDDLPPGERSP